MDEPNANEGHPVKAELEGKIRTYQNGKIVLDSEDFEALVDVFRTLLEWSNDLERTKKKGAVVTAN